MPMKTTPQTPPEPQAVSDLPRLPIDVSCYNVRALMSITGDQLWLCSLLVELRAMNEKLDMLLDRMGKGTSR